MNRVTRSPSTDSQIVFMFMANRRRDRKYGPADKAKSDQAGMLDHTEYQNNDFRYVL